MRCETVDSALFSQLDAGLPANQPAGHADKIEPILKNSFDSAEFPEHPHDLNGEI